MVMKMMYGLFIYLLCVVNLSECSPSPQNPFFTLTVAPPESFNMKTRNLSTMGFFVSDPEEIEDRLEIDRLPDDETPVVREIKNERYDSFMQESNMDDRASLDVESDSSKNGLILGKDRVLLQLNMDLKWLFLLLTDSTQWKLVGERISSTLLGLFDGFHSSKTMHQEVVNVISDIRFRNPRSTIRTFQGTLNQAIQHGYETDKLVVFYIEDNRSEYPSVFGSNFRKCLADDRIGSALNENFIFYAATTHSHKYFKQIYQLYGKLPKFPILLVVTPYDVKAASRVSVTIGSNVKRGFFSFLRRHKLPLSGFRRIPLAQQLNLVELEKHVCAALAVPLAELTGDSVFQFLLSAYMKNNLRKSHLREVNASARRSNETETSAHNKLDNSTFDPMASSNFGESSSSEHASMETEEDGISKSEIA